MHIFNISFAYLRAKWLNTILQITVMALGVMLMTALLIFGGQIKDRFYGNGTGVDAVVGAKGSPLQLVLSTIQHIDIPTGNIKLDEAKRVSRNRQVKSAVPIALGDSYQKFRIVGTDHEYLRLFKAEFNRGKAWQNPMEVVIGASVARESGLDLGDSFVGSHGLLPGGDVHGDRPYRVVGILSPKGTVLDRLILTSLQSVWDVHSHGEARDENPEITALLVTYRNRTAAFSFPRMINQQTALQAASPSFQIARLVELLGVGQDTMMLFAGVVIAIALASVLIGLVNNIRDRRYDLVLFRILGASKWKIVWLIVIEGMTIVFLGSIIGLLCGHGLIEVFGRYTQKGLEIGLSGFIFYDVVWWVLGGLLILSLFVSLIPAWEAYKTNMRNALKNA